MNLPAKELELTEEIINKFKPELLYLSGSRLYGVNTENSDYDYRGVVFPEVTHILGLGAVLNRFEQFDLTKTHNCMLFNIQKAFKLWIENNPNCAEIINLGQRFEDNGLNLIKCIIMKRKELMGHKAISHWFRLNANSIIDSAKKYSCFEDEFRELLGMKPRKTHVN